MPYDDDSVPYHRDTPTSESAAASKRATVEAERMRIYRQIVDAGFYGLTDYEVFGDEARGSRFRELAKRNLIVRTMRTRSTGRGQSAVWVATALLPPAAQVIMTGGLAPDATKPPST